MVDLQEMESDGFVTSRCSALSSHVMAPPTVSIPFEFLRMFSLSSLGLFAHVVSHFQKVSSPTSLLG